MRSSAKPDSAWKYYRWWRNAQTRGSGDPKGVIYLTCLFAAYYTSHWELLDAEFYTLRDHFSVAIGDC